MNLTCYTLKFLGATTDRKSLLTASARVAAARACLRLYDDAAYLKTTLKYGLRKQEGPLWGSLGVTFNLFTLSYLQAEKLMFLIDTGLLVVNSDIEFKIRTAHKLFWSLFSFVGLLRSIRALHVSAQALNSSSRTKCAPARFVQASLTSTKALLDVIHTVSWLPPGWLWGSSLSTQKASGIATLSAIIGLVLHYHAKQF
ncbi:uncharacterized protein LOC113237900 isoform X2 [Hyposmocoma kahamanoa]|nr:uncharacterized protein LOC113237900 isoform X2 [Hyposmocoma kahamanoa]